VPQDIREYNEMYTALSELILFAGFIAETTTFITGSAEDDDDLLVRVPSIEKCRGKCRRKNKWVME